MGQTCATRDLLSAPGFGWWEPLPVPPRGDPRPFTLQSMEIKYHVPDRRKRCPRTIPPK